MDRRAFIALVGGSILAAPLAVEPQPAGKMYRIGILGEQASDPSEARMWQTFQLGLREFGWIEGRNIWIESRWAEDNSARLPELAADLVRLKVDLLVTRGSTCEKGDIRDSHRLPRACRPPSDRPRGEPRQARREHHGTVLATDGDLSQRLRDPDLYGSRRQAGRRSVQPRYPFPHSGSQGAGGVSACAPGAVAAGSGAGRGGAGRRLHCYRPRASTGPFRALLPALQRRATAYGRVGHSSSATNDVRRQGPRRGGWPHELRRGFSRSLPARRHLRGQDPQGYEARRPPHRTANKVRASDQSQDGAGPRPYDPAFRAGAGRPSHRIARARPT